VLYKGRNVLAMNEDELQEVRGNEMSMIFQDPMTSLNPVYTVGTQICEAIRIHERADKDAGTRRAIDLLKQVGIPNADSRVDNYPHEFSGGMRQRAMIAMALACNPDVLIADEPTTALDVTIQAQIIELIDRPKDEFNSAVILITHDLGVVAEIATRSSSCTRVAWSSAPTRGASSTTRRCRTRGGCSGRFRGSTGRSRSGCTRSRARRRR
jgi:ABC-type dipeptide/oligopeptide/nickel transport system ATPase component